MSCPRALIVVCPSNGLRHLDARLVCISSAIGMEPQTGGTPLLDHTVHAQYFEGLSPIWNIQFTTSRRMAFALAIPALLSLKLLYQGVNKFVVSQPVPQQGYAAQRGLKVRRAKLTSSPREPKKGRPLDWQAPLHLGCRSSASKQGLASNLRARHRLQRTMKLSRGRYQNLAA